MIDDENDAHRPLSVVLKPVDDELLSSWSARHAAYYGVSKPFFVKWLMPCTRNLSLLDYRLGLAPRSRAYLKSSNATRPCASRLPRSRPTSSAQDISPWGGFQRSDRNQLQRHLKCTGRPCGANGVSPRSGGRFADDRQSRNPKAKPSNVRIF
jgi:hypothetical protein